MHRDLVRFRWTLAAACLLIPVASPAQSPSTILTLDDAVHIALSNNPQLRASSLYVRKAADSTAAARTGLLPTLQIKATGGVLLNDVNARIPSGALGVVDGAPFPVKDSSVYSASGGAGYVSAQITQPLTQLPVIKLDVRLQETGERLASEELRAKRLGIAADVKKTYFAIVEARDAIAAANDRLKYDQELERTVTDFVAHETALKADLLDAQAQAAAEQLHITELEDSVADDREQMNVLLGRDVDTPLDVTDPGDVDPPAVENAGFRQRALDHRPDLRVAGLQVDQAQLGARIKSQIDGPAVSLVLDYNQLGAGRLRGFPTNLSILGVELDWTPVDWGRSRHNANAVLDEYAAAQSLLADANARAVVDVDRDARAVDEARARLTAAKAANEAATERLREMTNRYKANAILLSDLLQEQSIAASASEKASQARLALRIANVELDAALGGDE